MCQNSSGGCCTCDRLVGRPHDKIRRHLSVSGAGHEPPFSMFLLSRFSTVKSVSEGKTRLDTHGIKNVITPYCTLGQADELVRVPPSTPPATPSVVNRMPAASISLGLLIGSHSNRQRSNGPIRCSSGGRKPISVRTTKLRDNNQKDASALL
jgi:hypothetical protein